LRGPHCGRKEHGKGRAAKARDEEGREG